MKESNNTSRSNKVYTPENRLLKAMATIQQIDEAFARYYESLNHQYHAEFATYCEDNGYDEDCIKNDIEQEASESELVEFDEHFPFRNPPHNQEEVMEFIHQLIRKFYYCPSALGYIIPTSYVDFWPKLNHIGIESIPSLSYSINSQ